jgi:hypothetical protein
VAELQATAGSQLLLLLVTQDFRGFRLLAATQDFLLGLDLVVIQVLAGSRDSLEEVDSLDIAELLATAGIAELLAEAGTLGIQVRQQLHPDTLDFAG